MQIELLFKPQNHLWVAGGATEPRARATCHFRVNAGRLQAQGRLRGRFTTTNKIQGFPLNHNKIGLCGWRQATSIDPARRSRFPPLPPTDDLMDEVERALRGTRGAQRAAKVNAACCVRRLLPQRLACES